MDKIVESLVKKIKSAKDAYYNSVPTMSDATYDLLEEELRKIDPKNPILKAVGTKAIGKTVVRHKMPMGSLDKIKTEEQLVKEFEDKECIVQEKMDGSSIALYYNEGSLRQAVTRGDGLEGELITFAVSRMENVEQFLPIPFTGSLRGEMILTESNFKSLAAESEYANPRNAANGIVKRKDARDCDKVKIVYFDVVDEKKTFKDEMEKMEYITNELGLEAVITRKCKNLKETQNLFNRYQKEIRKNLDYEIDGLVVKQGNKHLAYKFPALMATSTVKNIKWTTGQTGRVNPVVEIEPVGIGGITIKQITGNNINFLNDLGVSVGAKVVLSRRNDVIPAIEEVLVPGNGDQGEFDICPSCSTKTEKSGRYIKCPNKECEAQNESVLISYVRAMEWELLGEETIDRLKDKVKEPADFYKLNQKDFDAIGVSSNGAKILEQIKAKKEIDLAEFIASFAIPNTGASRVQLIIEAGFDTVEKILNVKYSDLMKMKGIQDATAKIVTEGFARRKEIILNTYPYINLKKTISSGKLSGNGIKFTGTMKNARKNLETLAKDNGAKIAWKSELKNILVTNDPDSGSSKNKEAQNKGYQIISEEDFLKSINFYK